jgi:hypothetical protein
MTININKRAITVGLIMGLLAAAIAVVAFFVGQGSRPDDQTIAARQHRAVVLASSIAARRATDVKGAADHVARLKIMKRAADKQHAHQMEVVARVVQKQQTAAQKQAAVAAQSAYANGSSAGFTSGNAAGRVAGVRDGFKAGVVKASDNLSCSDDPTAQRVSNLPPCNYSYP